MELPCTAAPLGLGAQGLPLGVQIVAGRGKDSRTIAVAMALQKHGVAKWTPPVACDKY